MKKNLLNLILVFLAKTILAQPYSLFLNNNVSFFVQNNSNHEIEAVKITYKQTSNDSTIYSFQKTWNYSDYTCIKPNGAMWLGSKCVQVGNTYSFFNQQNDTIKILPNTKLSDSWILYKNGQGEYIKATVRAIRKVIFLGIEDSIKIISLEGHLIKNEEFIDSPFEDSLKISKNYGLISIFKMNEFPIISNFYTIYGLTNPSLGKTFLTNKEIYDFEIGDEFHYDLVNSYPPYGTGRFSKIIKKVISKKYINNDSVVVYDFEIQDKQKLYDWAKHTETNFYTIDTITEKYNISEQNQFVPNEAIQDSGIIGYRLELATNNKRICNLFQNQLYKATDSECLHVLIGCGLYATPVLHEGCGDYSVGLQTESFALDYNNLIYYKKGNETCGTPYNFNSIENISNDKQLSIYPNPLSKSNLLTVELSESLISKVEIYDILGKKVLSQSNLASSKIELNLSDLQIGIYLIKVKNKNETFLRKIVKEK